MTRTSRLAHMTLGCILTLAIGCGGDGPPAPERGPSADERLLAAAYENDVAAAQKLIAEGADVNVKDGSEQSAYLIATSEVGDDPRLLEATLAAGADVNAHDSYDGTGLIRAAERGNHRIIRRLLDTDIEVDHVNRLGWTALLEAIILGDGGREHTQVVRLLIAADADVDIADKDGTTPLEHARSRGFDQIARILRAAGAR